MKIIENALPILVQSHISDTLLGDSFPWFHLKDLTGGYRQETQNRPAFAHHFVLNEKTNSDYIGLLNPIIDAVQNRTGKSFSKILKARSFLQVPLSNKILGKEKLDTFHVDLEEKHFVILYYVLDSDGKTILTDRLHKEGDSVMMDPDEKYEIVKRVNPKQGRILFFEGNRFHTAMQPKLNTRCIINIDVV
jgi:hypothetical protein